MSPIMLMLLAVLHVLPMVAIRMLVERRMQPARQTMD
jgi:hypothetical protein